jgi:hypothetical protein
LRRTSRISIPRSAVGVVDPLEAHVEDLDPQVPGPRPGGRENLLAELVSPEIDLLERVLLLRERGVHLRLPIGGPDDLHQRVVGHGVAGLAVEDVVQPALGSALVAQPLEEEQRVGDPPAGHGVDEDEALVAGGQLVGLAVPLEEALVEAVDLLDEGELEVQARLVDGVADRLTELGDDHLLGLVDHVDRRQEHDRQDDGEG